MIFAFLVESCCCRFKYHIDTISKNREDICRAKNVKKVLSRRYRDDETDTKKYMKKSDPDFSLISY
jgi:hypothetical protein